MLIMKKTYIDQKMNEYVNSFMVFYSMNKMYN